MKPSLYQALAGKPDPLAGHDPNENLYNSPGSAIIGKFKANMPFSGKIPSSEYDLFNVTYRDTNCFDIGYTKWGNKGPAVIFIHGVPTNRRQWYDVQKRVAHFTRTLSFDLLGMGDSDKPRMYGYQQSVNFSVGNWPHYHANPDQPPVSAWEWRFDSIYISQLVKKMFPNEKVTVVADDWGGGVASWFVAQFPELCNGLIKLNSIDFDGYPVSEIQAIGRAAMIENEEDFMKGMFAFDQTLVQIYKTMVRDPAVYNQYKLRDIKFPYVDTDYERPGATSLTLKIKFQNIRVLSDRAAILAPDLLLPFDPKHNPKGLPVNNITCPVVYINSGPNGDVGVPITGDSMMPSNQVWLPFYAYPKARWYSFHYVEHANHFVGTDRPRLVAEYVISAITNMAGKDKMADICLGFTGIWKGDESSKIAMLRKIYGKHCL